MLNVKLNAKTTIIVAIIAAAYIYRERIEAEVKKRIGRSEEQYCSKCGGKW